MSLKTIKNKIRSVKKTHKVTKAMEAVSAVKMRKSQERALVARPYATSALTILERLSSTFDAKEHPLSKVRAVKNVCMVVITSDKGLAGSHNSALLKNVEKLISKESYTKEQVHIIAIGTKAFDFFTKRGYEVIKSFQNISDEVKKEDMREVTDHIVKAYTDETFDRVYIAYTNFISTFEQNATSKQVLPLSLSDIKDLTQGIIPKKGMFKEEDTDTKTQATSYTIEPNPEDVLNELLPFLLNITVYHALLEAKASEHSARMVAMKNASDKAEEVSEELTLAFNKERQALITSEVSEIIGGMEVM